jgi:hypothetical protein
MIADIAFYISLDDSVDIKTLDDWYSVTASEVSKYREGGSILNYYKGSLINGRNYNCKVLKNVALQSLYPKHPWDILRFKFITRGYWNSVKNQRAWMDNLSKKIGTIHITKSV